MNVFYKLDPTVATRPVIAVPLEHDIEVTVFGDDGRDVTFKGRVGDYLVLEMTEEESWGLSSVLTPDDLEELYVPIGGK
jgi:hypothetical protein